MPGLYNLARMTTATTGTGTITLGSAVGSYLTFAQAGASNGETVTYAITDGANREIGRGVYTSSGTTLTRTVLKSTNNNAAISLSGTAEVMITAAAEDFADRQDALPNILINGDFQINQRGFAFGALADGAFGVDRWRASGASNLGWDAATQTLTLNSGAIRQVVEPLVWGYSNLASFQITASVEGLTGGNLTVAVGSVSGVITPGAGRRSVTLTLGAGDTGNLAVTLTPASYPTLWKRVKLELGAAATAWQARPTVEEVALCMRYYQNGFPNGVAPVDGYTFTQSYYASGVSDPDNRLFAAPVTFQVPMRATPTVFVFRSNVAATTNGRWQYFNGSAWVAGSSTFPGTINEKGFRMTVDGTGLTAGSSYLLIGGWAASSEL